VSNKQSQLLTSGGHAAVLASHGAEQLVLALAQECESWYQIGLTGREARELAGNLVKAANLLAAEEPETRLPE
jgi:hypothetical protein